MRATILALLLAAAAPAQVIGTGYGAVGLPIQTYGNASIGGVATTVTWYQPQGAIGAVCYLSLGGSGIAFPAWHGDILIDLGQVVVISAMADVAQTSGVEWVCSQVIPNNAAFVGLVVYAQAVVADGGGGFWLSLGSYFMVTP